MTFEEALSSLDNETDLDILNSARNRVANGKSENSLVAWTMSEEWTEATSRGKMGGCYVPRNRTRRFYCNQTSGEFEAK